MNYRCLKIKKYILEKIKFCFYKILYPVIYKIFSICKIKKNKIIFIENNQKELSNNFQSLFFELKKNKENNIRIIFLKKYNNIFFQKCFQYIYTLVEISTAKVIFIDEVCPLLDCCSLRDGTQIINVWHGCGAFKKFGYSTADLIFGLSREEFLTYPQHRNYAFITVSSSEVINCYAEAMNIKEDKILPIGVSRTDIFFNGNFINTAYENIYSILPKIKNKKIILYAPTFRGQVNSATAPNKINIEFLYKYLKEEYVILIKQHPLVKHKKIIDKKYKEFCIDVTDIFSIDELISVSDILITDYSTVIFEWSLFEKPAIFFAYDLNEYIDWRGFYYKYENFVPGQIVKNNKELLDAIIDIKNFDYKRLMLFKNKFMSACDGKSTERILKLVNNYLQ